MMGFMRQQKKIFIELYKQNVQIYKMSEVSGKIPPFHLSYVFHSESKINIKVISGNVKGNIDILIKNKLHRGERPCLNFI